MPTQLASAPKKTFDLFGVHKPQELVQLRKSGKNVKMKVVLWKSGLSKDLDSLVLSRTP